MLITLNYLIFLTALAFSLQLFRRDYRYREAAIHMGLFAVAALLGGLAHHMVREQAWLMFELHQFNQHLPTYFRTSPLSEVYIRVWMATFIAIGLTEYYFMRVFLHPIADNLKLNWIKGALKTSLGLFLGLAFFIDEYSLVVAYHLVTHTLVAGFSFYLVFKKKLTIFWHLIALVTFNLAAGAIWALMALGEIATGMLHYNDWYHVMIIIFIGYLYWALTKGQLVTQLESEFN